MMDPKDLRLRLATSEDYEEIKERFPRVYGGADYVPAQYRKYFLAQNRYCCFVAEHEGRIVGFNVRHIVHEGQAQIAFGNRVVDEYQRKGIQVYLNAFADAHMKDAHRESWAIKRWTEPKGYMAQQRMAKKANPNISITGTRQYAFFTCTMEQLLQAHSKCDAILRTKPSFKPSSDADQCLAILGSSSEKEGRGCLPEILVLRWFPYHIGSCQDDLLHQVQDYGMKVSYTTLQDFAANQIQPIFFAANQNHPASSATNELSGEQHSAFISSIGFSIFWTCPIGIHMTLDFYGSNLEDVWCHFLILLKQRKDDLMEEVWDNMVVSIYHDDPDIFEKLVDLVQATFKWPFFNIEKGYMAILEEKFRGPTN